MLEFVYPQSSGFLSHVYDVLGLANIWPLAWGMAFLYIFVQGVVDISFDSLNLPGKTEETVKKSAARTVLTLNIFLTGFCLWIGRFSFGSISVNPYVHLPWLFCLVTLIVVWVGFLIFYVQKHIFSMEGVTAIEKYGVKKKVLTFSFVPNILLLFFKVWWNWYSTYIFQG